MRNTPLKVAAIFLFAFTLYHSSARAEDVLKQVGDAIDDGVKKTKKETKKAKKKLDKAGKEVGDTASDAADATVDTAKDVGKDAKKAVDDVGKKTTDTTNEAGRQTKKWSKQGTRVALKGRKELEKIFSKEGLDAMVAGLQKRVDQTAMWEGVVAKIEAERPAAEAQMAKTKELTDRVKTEGEKFKNTVDGSLSLVKEFATDAESTKKLERLMILCAEGKFTSETDDLGKWFAKKITAKFDGGGAKPKTGPAAPKQTMVANKGSPAIPTYPAKSFALTLGWNFVAETGLVIAGGFEGRFGVTGDLFWDKDSYDVRGVFSLAESLGAGVAATGAGFDLAVNLMLTVSPTPVSNASGVFFGVSGEGGAGVGFEFELEWGFANGTLVGVPQISAAVGYQDIDPGAAVLGNLGYAVTYGRNGWDHGIPGVPTK